MNINDLRSTTQSLDYGATSKDSASTPVNNASSSGLPQLKFYGGKVLKQPKFFSVFLGSYWKTKRGAKEVDYHNSFAKSLFSSDHMKIWKEYGVSKATHIGSETIAGTPRTRTIDESRVKELIWQEIQQHRAPKPDGKTVYTLYLPPGSILTSSDGYSSLDGLGGYHGSFDMPGEKRIYYSALAYSQGSNGIDFTGSPRQNITVTASHEWAEAATDPDVNNGKLGWYDKNYGEVGDIPLSMGMELTSIAGDVNGFKVQKEWSNEDDCAEVLPNSCE